MRVPSALHQEAHHGTTRHHTVPQRAVSYGTLPPHPSRRVAGRLHDGCALVSSLPTLWYSLGAGLCRRQHIQQERSSGKGSTTAARVICTCVPTGNPLSHPALRGRPVRAMPPPMP